VKYAFYNSLLAYSTHFSYMACFADTLAFFKTQYVLRRLSALSQSATRQAMFA